MEPNRYDILHLRNVLYVSNDSYFITSIILHFQFNYHTLPVSPFKSCMVPQKSQWYPSHFNLKSFFFLFLNSDELCKVPFRLLLQSHLKNHKFFFGWRNVDKYFPFSKFYREPYWIGHVTWKSLIKFFRYFTEFWVLDPISCWVNKYY